MTRMQGYNVYSYLAHNTTSIYVQVYMLRFGNRCGDIIALIAIIG